MSRDIGPAPRLGDVETGILLAAEQVAHDASWWSPQPGGGECGVQVIPLALLEQILRRSSVLRGQSNPTPPALEPFDLEAPEYDVEGQR